MAKPIKHEEDLVQIKPVVLTLVGAILVMLLVHLSNYLLLKSRDLPRESTDTESIEAFMEKDFADLVDKHHRQLDSSDWVDREEGIIRIPIEQAIDIVVKESGSGVERDQPEVKQ